MQADRKFMAACILTLLTFSIPGWAVSGQSKSLVASAKGEGTIRLGNEEFKIHAVVVKLFADGKAEINLVTDITVFIKGTWSRGNDAEKVIDLRITGSMSDGGGKLFLGEDRKSIVGLKLELTNRTTKKIITADFLAK